MPLPPECNFHKSKDFVLFITVSLAEECSRHVPACGRYKPDMQQCSVLVEKLHAWILGLERTAVVLGTRLTVS